MTQHNGVQSDNSIHPDFALETDHLNATVKAIDQRIAVLSKLSLTKKDWTKEAARRMRIAALDRMEKARAEPYFGRVDFTPDDRSATETYRIGRAGGPGVTDWRAPVASLFYSRGGSSYEAPGGTVSGRVALRRHYRIEKAQLLELFDAQVADGILDSLSAGEDMVRTGRGDERDIDAYLVRQLGRDAGRQMRDIVSTIQSEQDRVLRAPLYKVVVLQGVAGSGKTAVALHRVAYLLYTYADRIQASNILILAPNRLLLQYVERLLPASLGVEGVIQKTIRQWQRELLDLNSSARFVETGPPVLSQFTRSDGAVETLASWAAGRADIRRSGGRAGKSESPAGRLAFAVWREFLTSPAGAAKACGRAAAPVLAAWADQLRAGWFSPADLSAMAFLAERLGRYSEGQRYDHIVVDEAQDLDPLLCDVLARRCRHPSLTLVGDLAQSLGQDAAPSWEAVIGGAFRPAQVAQHSFHTNYRSSRQIVQFSRAILERGGSGCELPVAVPRDSAPVGLIRCQDAAAVKQALLDTTARLTERFGSVLILTADQTAAREVLGWAAPLGFTDPRSAASLKGGRGMKVVAPLRAVRGMEYDAVILYDPGHEAYREPGAGARRLYTAATRALHELHVVWTGDPGPYLPVGN